MKRTRWSLFVPPASAAPVGFVWGMGRRGAASGGVRGGGLPHLVARIRLPLHIVATGILFLLVVLACCNAEADTLLHQWGRNELEEKGQSKFMLYLYQVEAATHRTVPASDAHCAMLRTAHHTLAVERAMPVRRSLWHPLTTLTCLHAAVPAHANHDLDRHHH